MSEVREVAEELADHLKEIMAKAQKPRKRTAAKVGVSVSIMAILAFLIRLAWEIYQTPSFENPQ